LNLSRQQLQAVATGKLDDAVLLLVHGRYSNASYLAGYAVEVALKAVIAKQFLPGVIPEKGLVNSIYTHDLRDCLDWRTFGAELKRKAARSRSPAIASIVSQWSEARRYDIIEESRARELLEAVGEAQGGVFPWIILHW
jgi:HEPN domain-containing protein